MAAEAKGSSLSSAEAKGSKGAEEADEDEFDDLGLDFDVPSEGKGSPSPVKGLEIDLDLVASRRSEGSKAVSDEDLIVEMASQPVRVLFCLPDGSQAESEFQMGQSVEVLKSFIELECGIPMASQSLFLETGVGPLLDPLSLLDYPTINPKEELIIRVEGDMEEDGGAKK